MEKKKGWFRQQGSETVIVLVHGLFSNNEKCWSHTNGTSYWPDIISKDSRFDGIDIYLASFYTSLTSSDYKVSNCADEVLLQLKTPDENNVLPPLERKNIIFLTHSTGGIVARYILESNRALFKKKKIGLALYASPSYGSKMAHTLGSVAKIFKNELAQELSWGSAILSDLDDRFRELLDGEELDIHGIEAYENKPPFGFLALNNSMKRVVEKQSASRYFGKAKLVPDSDHSSIVKPISMSDYQHSLFYSFLFEKKLIPSRIKAPQTSRLSNTKSLVNAPKKPDVLFDFYHPIHESVYVVREEDKLVNNAIKSNGLWVCGQTGVGKTTSIQRALMNTGANYKYISLGVCVNEPIDVLFSEIYSKLSNDLEYQNKSIKVTLNKIENELKTICSNQEFILFIEEIPISDQEMFVTFSQYIYALIMQMSKVSNFKIVLSSIYEPKAFGEDEFDKISEKLKVIKSSKWSTSEMLELVQLIEQTLNLTESNLDNLPFFDGSPRKAKIFYRDKMVQTKEVN